MGQFPVVTALITSRPNDDLELCRLFLLNRVSVMNSLLCLVIIPALLSAQLSYQVPESLSPDDENPNYRLAIPRKRTYVLHRGPNGEPRYSSLVRRNFLRFGKRSGGSLLGAPDYSGVRPQSDSFFNHLDRIPIAELRGPEQKPQLKRARDYLRFGKREEMGTEGDEENDYIEDEELNFPAKRYGRRRISNFLRFG